jgi:hypothetical protein
MNRFLVFADSPPTSNSLRDLVTSVGVLDFVDQPQNLLRHLVAAYKSQLEHDSEEGEIFEICGRDAESAFMHNSIAGYRSVLPMEESSDEKVYECCDWSSCLDDFQEIIWPVALLKRIAYLKGVAAAKRALAISKYYKERG